MHISRRGFLKGTIAGMCFSALHPFFRAGKGAANPVNPLFWVRNIPNQPFYGRGSNNYHAGVDYLLRLMGDQGLKFYRSSQETVLSGPSGMIETNDVVLIKVNAQWKYRGCTNSDLIRGLIQRILDHPDGFNGEVVIFENGQSQGSLNGDALGWGNYPDSSIHANANDESHSFLYLVNTVFDDPKVSAFLLDPFENTFIGATDHATNGYRTFENISYPCFSTPGGHRVELREGIWNGSGYSQNLKLINVPVLKYHGGSEITASLKHFYGVVSMADGQSPFRHYSGLGETCGKMVVSVRAPVLNIMDAIWVSHASTTGYPASTTFRANQILASQDPVALDYWATKYILYPKTNNPNHLPIQGPPSNGVIDAWLTTARDTVNNKGGIYNPNGGIQTSLLTKNENEMLAHSLPFSRDMVDFDGDIAADITVYHSASGLWFAKNSSNGISSQVGYGGPGYVPVPGDYDGDGKTDVAVYHQASGLWFIKPSSGAPGYYLPYGGPGYLPVPGDYDGDGKTDVAVYHQTSGLWFIKPSSGAADYYLPYGGPGYVPVPGDYDGDGKTDVAVYHQTSGLWYVKKSSDGAFFNVAYGGSGYDPVLGDYDGDGKTDFAVYHQASGFWYIMKSSDYGSYYVNYGGSGYVPVPGDYDGDGKIDLAVYHSASGLWFIKPSSGAAEYTIGYGGAGYTPVN